ncbi:cytochrome C oxidase subunit II [Bacillus sp. FJAT-27264]|uniref:cupredoxin domain-containing protein n=1 Tax=Paenibacillus sp. (strain DSM 101736 / FJAT-27264) TaxID=1850362 RepID=UPI000807F67A|nr:cupredoxin domain-containing protein [Bacillus sp. FJAT-27264]OBZ11832.1 cytochrome C oxidase subunit II [Bacillus sp. FJAT-27264]
MKSKIALFLSLFCVLILAACANSGSNVAGSSTNAVKEPEIQAETELVIKAKNYSFDQEEYHLKKGVPVKIIFENESGNHGILVPELNLQLSGKKNTKVIVPEETGTFQMTCSIMCGAGHTGMIANVIVEE